MKNLKNYYTEFEAKKSKLIVKSVGRRWGSFHYEHNIGDSLNEESPISLDDIITKPVGLK